MNIAENLQIVVQNEENMWRWTASAIVLVIGVMLRSGGLGQPWLNRIINFVLVELLLPPFLYRFDTWTASTLIAAGYAIYLLMDLQIDYCFVIGFDGWSLLVRNGYGIFPSVQINS